MSAHHFKGNGCISGQLYHQTNCLVSNTVYFGKATMYFFERNHRAKVQTTHKRLPTIVKQDVSTDRDRVASLRLMLNAFSDTHDYEDFPCQTLNSASRRFDIIFFRHNHYEII